MPTDEYLRARPDGKGKGFLAREHYSEKQRYFNLRSSSLGKSIFRKSLYFKDNKNRKCKHHTRLTSASTFLFKYQASRTDPVMLYCADTIKRVMRRAIFRLRGLNRGGNQSESFFPRGHSSPIFTAPRI